MAVVVILGAGAAVADLAHQNHAPDDPDDEALQDDLASVNADVIEVGALLPIVLIVGIALAATRLAGGG